MGRYEQSLYKMATNNPSSFSQQEMQDCLYGLVQEIPGLWEQSTIYRQRWTSRRGEGF